MTKEELINFIENSFLKEILDFGEVTDISYNGKQIYYVLNNKGRMKYNHEISSDVVKDFIRQLANITEKQFSYLNPILDVNVGRYRINAVNTSIARVGLEGAVSLSIRIASQENKIKQNSNFMPIELEHLFSILIKNHKSIIISGITGVGKTELQKYLISLMDENERIVVIDQTIELASLQSSSMLDITLWQTDEKNPASSISSLIKNGLRNNPDWLIVSEARGEEMNDVLNSALTGIPIITTIHSLDASSAVNRMARMIMKGDKQIDYENVLSNLNYHFRIYIHLKKILKKNEPTFRYISSVIEVDDEGNQHIIYSDDLKTQKFAKLSKNFSNSLDFDRRDRFVEVFIDE